MFWSGTAAVYVSIVNWQKGEDKNLKLKRLYCPKEEKKDTEFYLYELGRIPSSLSPNIDVTNAKTLICIASNKTCFQGQTHGHDGFLISIDESKEIIKNHSESKNVLFPYLIAEELIGKPKSTPNRCVIDFQNKSIYEAQKYKDCFNIVEKLVLPKRKIAAE